MDNVYDYGRTSAIHPTEVEAEPGAVGREGELDQTIQATEVTGQREAAARFRRPVDTESAPTLHSGSRPGWPENGMKKASWKAGAR